MKKDRYCLQGVHDLIFAMTIKLQHTVLNIFGANYQFLFSGIKKHSKPMWMNKQANLERDVKKLELIIKQSDWHLCVNHISKEKV